MKTIKTLLAICFIFCVLPNGNLHAATIIKNLRVGYMKNPVGIDDVQPHFSWIMESDLIGQQQTAYEISLLSEDNKSVIWNSGKIDSEQSVAVKYTGTALSPSTRYNWTVSVWDKDQIKITSGEDAYFETGLMSSGWSGAKWLKVKDAEQNEEPVNFTFECDITVVDQNAGVIFGAKDINNMHMWSICTHNTQSGQAVLRRHIFTNGDLTLTNDVQLEGKFTKEDIIGHEKHLKIDVVNNVIHTYIDNQLVDSYTSPDLKTGYIGFRVYTGNDDTHEHGYIDNVKYKYYVNGESRTFTEDFENGSNDFDGTNTIMVGGNTKMDLIASGNTDLRVLQSTANGIPMFRTEFGLTKAIKSARIYSSGLGVYDMFINGSRVGTPMPDGTMVYDEFKPGWTDYRKTVFYSVYDITPLLVKGQNTVGALVSSGWFNGAIAKNEYGNPPLGFIAKIIVEYTDGTKQTIVTNTEDWKASTNSAIRMADIYHGESYDARKESNWTVSGFDVSDWGSTEVNTYFKGDMLSFIGDPVRIRPEMEQTPQVITIYDGINTDGTTFGEVNVINTITGNQIISLRKGETAIYDFGQNFVGWINFKVKGTRGTKLRGRFAEMLNDSGSRERGNDNAKGTLYLENLRSAKATMNYILKGDVEGETYHPSMTFFGFRYCEISASEDITIESMKGEVLGNVCEENSSFSTNNKLVNQLYSNVIWGQRGNFLSVPTDCPQRDERLGWMGDTQIFSRAAAYNADVVTFFQKWAKDVRDSQQPDGTYPSVVPDNWRVGYGRTAWAEAAIIVPWNIYLMYGDTQILSDHYASMEKFMDWMAAQKFDGYLYNGGDTQYGDWLAYENTDARYISVSYYAYAAQLLADISEALSKSPGDFYDQKKTEYIKLYTNIKAEFQKRYVSSRTGMLNASSQTAYLLALKNDLFPTEESRQAGLTQLLKKIQDNGNKLSTGFVGTGILNQTLSENGADDMAYTLLLQRNDPSWLYSVDQGATTIWERWNSYTIAKGFGDPGMNSFNHYSYGAVSEWMYRFMAGIEADKDNAGFKHIILQPNPDTRNVGMSERITEVDAVFGSYYGNIKSKWEQNADRNYRYSVTVPANTTATLYIRKINNATSVKQNNIDAKNVEGVVSFTDEGNRFALELQSGSYVFDTYNSAQSFLDKPIENENIFIYPNPVNKGKKLTIVTNPEESLRENSEINIYTLLGKHIANYKIKEEVTEIFMNMDTAVYALEWRNGGKTEQRMKLIVN